MESCGIDFSHANRFGGRVAAVVYRGSEADVWLDCGGREVVSILPRSVVEGMDLHIGEDVFALVNREDVALMKAVSQVAEQ